MKKPKQPTIEDLVKEKNKLLVSGDDPERAKTLTQKIYYFYYGIE